MRQPGFIGPSYEVRAKNVDCQRCVNLYPEIDELRTGKAGEVASLIGTPGLALLVALPTGPIRGEYRVTSSGDFYVVAGNQLYKVASDWTYTAMGSLITQTGTVSMSDNGTQLIVVDGPYGYILPFSNNAWQRITADGFTGADKVVFIDGYFIVNRPDSQVFQISALYDGLQWDALDFGTAEGSPDNIVSIEEYRNQLIVFGERTIEPYYDSGDEFPFTRVQGGFIEFGCAAAQSVAKLDDKLFWLGQNDYGQGVVYTLQGYQPARVSNYAVELAIQGYGDISDAVAYAYQQDGHSFYVLNFTGANTTWVYDTTTGIWHERDYTNDGVSERHRANCHTFVFDTHVVGDYANGNLYAFRMDQYTDNGATITRLRAAPHLTGEDLDWVFYSRFQLDMKSGTGLDGTQQGTNPQVMLDWSNDGGYSWSPKQTRSMGQIGQYTYRAIWNRLGKSRDRVHRVTITDPVEVVLIGAVIKAGV